MVVIVTIKVFVTIRVVSAVAVNGTAELVDVGQETPSQQTGCVLTCL